MITKTKKKLMDFAEILHLRIFGHEMSDAMREFLGHLSWSFFGGMFASFLLFLTTVLAGRMLGPEEFGKYNILISIANILITVILFGTHVSAVRYLSDKKFIDKHGTIMGLSFLLPVLFSIIFFVIIFFNNSIISKILNFDTNFLYLVFLYSVIFSYKNLFFAFFRAFHVIKKQIFARIIEALTILFFSYLLLYYLKFATYEFYVSAIIVGGLFFIFATFVFLAEKIKLIKFNLLKEKEFVTKFIKKYSIPSLLGSFFIVLLPLDKLFINSFIGLKEAGIYSAYYTASYVVFSEVMSSFVNPFLPSVIKNIDSLQGILKKIYKIFISFSPLWILLDFIVTSSIVLLFGKSYGFNLLYALLFAINSFAGALFIVVYFNLLSIHFIFEAVGFTFLILVISLSVLFFSHSIYIYVAVQAAMFIFSILAAHKLLQKT